MKLADADCRTVGAFQETDVCSAAAASAAAGTAGAAAGEAAEAADTAAAGVVLVVLPAKVAVEKVEVCEPVKGTLGALECHVHGIFCLTHQKPAHTATQSRSSLSAKDSMATV